MNAEVLEDYRFEDVLVALANQRFYLVVVVKLVEEQPKPGTVCRDTEGMLRLDAECMPH